LQRLTRHTMNLPVDADLEDAIKSRPGDSVPRILLRMSDEEMSCVEHAGGDQIDTVAASFRFDHRDRGPAVRHAGKYSALGEYNANMSGSSK